MASASPDSRRITLEQAFHHGRTLQAEGKLADAKRVFEQILLQVPHHSESLTLLASTSYQLGDAIQGDAYATRAVEVLQQHLVKEPNATPARALLANLLLSRGRRAEAEAICERLFLPLNPIRMSTAEFNERRQSAAFTGLPPMIINTLPKSASESIWNQLAEGLGLAQAHVSLGLFPDCCVLGTRAAALGQGGLITKEHIPATAHNLRMLTQAGVKRMVFHQRDPRQATLSWAHFVRDDVSMRLMAPLWRRIVPPAAVLKQGELGPVVDWAIENYLPLLTDFVTGWTVVERERTQGMEVLFMDFETFRRTPEVYMETVLAFHRIDPQRFRRQEAAEAEVVHLRKGQIEEWREVFTPDQAARAWETLPPALRERFGWQP